MKRVLFVDDEPRVLEGLENLMFSLADEWQMDTAKNGEEALSKLEHENFDVIVTDIYMPVMDGATLLRRVKEQYPKVVRIILSGQSELEPALRTMPVAHQYLSKPCNATDLIGVLRRACDLHALVNDDCVREMLGGVDGIPARPKIYSEITKLLADNEAPLEEIARIVEQDIGISTKVLQVANTAFFSRGNIVNSVHQAVLRLGIKVVNNLVLVVEVFRNFADCDIAGFSIDELHRHAFVTASIAQQLPDDAIHAEDAFLAATLHDVGKLILATNFPEQFARSFSESAQTGQPLHVVEAEMGHASHAGTGAYVLGLWGLPYPIIEAVANHHQPQRAESGVFDAVSAVYAANILAQEAAVPSENTTLDLGYLQRVGVADRVDEWRELATEIWTALK